MVRSVARMAGLVTLAIIILLLFFAIDIETRLPWMILALVVASAVAAPPSPDASQWRSVWPYGLYIVGLAVALAFSRSSQSVSEVGRQALFLATVFAAANLRPRERTRAGLLLLVLAGITVNLARVFGDPYRYRLDFVHRAEGFGRVSQWSGYPEIGLLAAIGAAAALATVAAAPRRPLQLSAAVLWGVFVLATGLSYSRLAWVTVGVVSVTLLALAWYRWRAASAGVLLATLVLAGILAGGSSIGRLRAGSLDASPIALRAVEWKAALAMFLDRPGVGVGPGRYPDAFPQYTDAVEVEGETEGYGAHAHNIVLQVAAELGIIGLLGYVAMWARVLWRSYSAGGPSRAGVVAFAVHACLLTVFVRSLGDNFFAPTLATGLRSLLLTGVLFGLAEADARGGPSMEAASRNARLRRTSSPSA